MDIRTQSLQEFLDGHITLGLLREIYALPKSEQQDRITMGIMAGDFTQDDVDYLWDRWDNYD